MYQGEIFGVKSLIKDGNISASFKAKTDVVMFELKKSYFIEAINSNEDIKKYVQNFLFNKTIQNFLRKFSIFGELDPKDVTQWYKMLSFEPIFKKSQTVFKTGDEADKFYIIIQGKAEVVIDNEVVSTLKTGEFFGELAIMNDQPRAATIRAQEDLTLASISKNDFKELIESSPKLTKKIYDVINMYRISPQNKGEISEEIIDAFDPIQFENVLEKVEIKPKESILKNNKFPFTKEFDPSDTISACIKMVSNYFDKDFSLTRIRDIAQISQSAKDMMTLTYGAEQLGFHTKIVEQESVEKLHTIATPFIAKTKNNRFVVVYKVEKNELLIANPSSGLKKSR